MKRKEKKECRDKTRHWRDMRLDKTRYSIKTTASCSFLAVKLWEIHLENKVQGT
jgi:hypothetical protein